MVSQEIKDAIKNAIAESMTDIVSSTAQATKRALKEDLDEAVDKRARFEDMPKFKRKLNEDQFQHSKEMERIMDRVSTHLDKDEKEKAKEAVNEGKKLLAKRQKLIKIADREEDGWEVIKCYKSDVLASDTDDEKRLGKSRRQARLNKKESKEKRLSWKKRYESKFIPRDFIHRDYHTFNSRSQTREQRICYTCRKEGHMQYSRPERRRENFSKGRS